MMPEQQNNLIRRYFDGDEQSLEILIRHYLQPIYSFVYRYVGNVADVEDITQEVFVKMWRNLKKFDQQKSFKTWLFSIAKNAALDFLKKKQAMSFSIFENEKGENTLFETLSDPAPLPDELFARRDLAKLVSAAMDKLSPPYRMVLFLRYNDHFNFWEIAESLGESINTVKSRHRRALIILKSILEETGSSPSV